MKIRFLWLAGVVLPVLVGCANANSETEKPGTNVISKPATVAPPNMVTLVVSNATPEAVVPIGEPVNTEVAPPSNLKLSPAATEITKMVQAGVDSSVVLAYVTNSRNTFRLEADEIVYLKDIGMAPEVVTAMIQQDQRLRNQTTTGQETAPAQATASVWSAAQSAAPSNVWQQEVAAPAPAAQASTSTTVPPPPAEEVPAAETVNYFYDSLAPYGTWIDVEGYGRSWRPTVVVTTPEWQPYSHAGRWVWTDYGWYWYSDYSWGWAPFHYGRWYSHPRWGWCWMPGSTWGPSWVSWRYSDSHYGWAPLPPAAHYSPSIGFSYYGNSCGSSFSFGLTWDCFTFVSYNNFQHHRYDRDRVPRHQVVNVYNNTTVVNNIIRGNNNTIINQGVAPTRIAAVTGTQIERVAVRESRSPRTGGATRHEEIGRDGKSLQVVRAEVPAGTPRGTVRAGGNTRGGAQNLTAGNAVAAPAPVAPVARENGLVPPRPATARNTVPPRNETHGNTTIVTPAVSPANATPGLAPKPNTGGQAPQVRTRQPEPQQPTTRQQNPPGTLIVRTPRATTSPNTTSVATANGTPAPVVAAPRSTPAVTAPASSGNVRSTATPWINNTPTAAQPVKEPNASTRPAPIRQDVRTENNDNNNRQPTPRSVAPIRTPAPAAPAHQAPAAPRVYSAPAAPQVSQPIQSYTPPARTVERRSTPAPSSPTYTPPAPRQPSTPSYSPPPTRSEPRSEPKASHPETRSSGGASKSSDDRSARGR